MTNFKSCNAHITEELERQMRLIEKAMKAVEEGDFDRGYLFNNSAKKCAYKIHEFVADMLDAQAEQAGCIL